LGSLYTRKTAQVVTDLQTSCSKVLSSRYQDVFALLVPPSCCDKSGTSCYHLVTRLMTVTDLLQVVPTRLIQAVRNKLLRTCCHQLLTWREYQTCWDNLLRVCWPHQSRYKMITSLEQVFQTCQQVETSGANTSC
jgi:hypothetical protein